MHSIIFLNILLLHHMLVIALSWVGVFRNDIVQFRLGKLWLIRLVVSMPSVTNHIYKDVFVKLLTEFYRQLGRKHHSFRIITIDMDNRCVDDFRYIRTIDGRT